MTRTLAALLLAFALGAFVEWGITGIQLTEMHRDKVQLEEALRAAMDDRKKLLATSSDLLVGDAELKKSDAALKASCEELRSADVKLQNACLKLNTAYLRSIR